jgi:hypothetical protein
MPALLYGRPCTQLSMLRVLYLQSDCINSDTDILERPIHTAGASTGKLIAYRFPKGCATKSTPSLCRANAPYLAISNTLVNSVPIECRATHRDRVSPIVVCLETINPSLCKISSSQYLSRQSRQRTRPAVSFDMSANT